MLRALFFGFYFNRCHSKLLLPIIGPKPVTISQRRYGIPLWAGPAPVQRCRACAPKQMQDSLPQPQQNMLAGIMTVFFNHEQRCICRLRGWTRMHLLNDKSEEPLTFFGRLDSLIDTLPVPLLSSRAQTLFLLSLDNTAK